jgi:hypothetical protein
VKKVKIALCNFRDWEIFTLETSQVLLRQRNTKSRKAQVTLEKRLSSGGRTPLFPAKPPKSSLGRSRPRRIRVGLFFPLCSIAARTVSCTLY